MLHEALAAIRSLREGRPIRIADGLAGSLVAESLGHPNFAAKCPVELDRSEQERIVLMSGGMDSAALWVHECDRGMPRAVYVSAGARYQDQEMASLRARGISVECIELSETLEDYDKWGWMVPLRQMIFVLAVAEKQQERQRAYRIAIGAHHHETKPIGGDKSLTFKILINQVLSSKWWPGEVEYPLAHRTKGEIATMLRQRVGDDALLATWTCYGHGEIHCGECYGCFNRAVALTAAGIQLEAQLWSVHPSSALATADVRRKVREALEVVARNDTTIWPRYPIAVAREIVAAVEIISPLGRKYLEDL